MLIRSKILRAGGTKVSLSGATYHFHDYKGDPSIHVAEIDNKAHVAQLLSIPEGYEIFSAKNAEAAEREAEAIIAAEKEADKAEADRLSAMTDDELSDAFEAFFGRKPNRAARRFDIENKVRAEEIRRETETDGAPETETEAKAATKTKAKAD